MEKKQADLVANTMDETRAVGYLTGGLTTGLEPKNLIGSLDKWEGSIRNGVRRAIHTRALTVVHGKEH